MRTDVSRCLAAASALAVFLAASLLPAAAQDSKTTIHGAWTVACGDQGCEARQDVFDPTAKPGSGGKPIARLFLSRNGGALTAKVEGPMGMALEAGMALFTDGHAALLLPYQSCRDNYCMASAELDEQLAKTMGGAGKFEIVMADISAKIFYFPVSLSGYGDTLAALGLQSADIPATEKMVVHPQEAPAH